MSHASASARAKADQLVFPMFGGDGETVKAIPAADAYDLIINVHYAARIPSISYAFGLFEGDRLEGVVTYGTPAAAPARTGLLGPEMADRVLELNRLCLRSNHKNAASMLVARSLKMLPRPSAIVSFADCAQGHIGTVYQAANFIYTGLSAKRTNWQIDGLEPLHGQTVADMFRHAPKGRTAAIREHYGDAFRLVERSRKHRYVYFIGSHKERKAMLAALRYPEKPYPKVDAGDSEQ